MSHITLHFAPPLYIHLQPVEDRHNIRCTFDCPVLSATIWGHQHTFLWTKTSDAAQRRIYTADVNGRSGWHGLTQFCTAECLSWRLVTLSVWTLGNYHSMPCGEHLKRLGEYLQEFQLLQILDWWPSVLTDEQALRIEGLVKRGLNPVFTRIFSIRTSRDVF